MQRGTIRSLKYGASLEKRFILCRYLMTFYHFLLQISFDSNNSSEFSAEISELKKF